MSELPLFVEQRLTTLPKGLREHIQRSREVGEHLAQVHSVDAVKTDIGLAAHDLARAMKPEDLLAEAKRLDIPIQPIEERHPVLLHGPIAAAWLEDEAGFHDHDILEAVRWHTTGLEGMGRAAKVVFLADKLDPMKVRRYPYLEKVLELSTRDIDEALLELLNQELAFFLREDYLIHPNVVALRNELMMGMDDKRGD